MDVAHDIERPFLKALHQLNHYPTLAATGPPRTRYTLTVNLACAKPIDDSKLHTHYPSNGAGGH